MYKKYLELSFVKIVIGGALIMFPMQMFYYRTQFTLDQFGVSVYLNFFIVGWMEIVANLIISCIVSQVPRKIALKTLIILLIVMLVVLILSESLVLQTIIEGFMRLFGTSIMIVLGIYVPQLFKTYQRGFGSNIIMSFGVLGSAFSQKILNELPYWVLTIFLLVTFVGTTFLHETKNIKKK